MKKSLNEQIVATIRNSLPANINIVSFLSDLFFWNKESIYRRLRSEIPFSYEDVVKIASAIDFSIDNIILTNQSERVTYDMSLTHAHNFEDLYCEKREQIYYLSNRIGQSGASYSMFALNYFPYSFSIFFEALTKFDYYKWLHRTNRLNMGISMSEVSFPSKVADMRQLWLNQDRGKEDVTYILDNNVFLSVIKEISYFYDRNLINAEELDLLRNDLLQLLDTLAMLAETGLAKQGAKVQLYVSPVDIPTNYYYIKYDDTVCCHMQVYGIDILQSHYPEACELQKQWVDLYKSYSILISRCNEKERFDYLDKQRDYIRLLDPGIK